jgi:putative spermidine/putrescine transport system permease protein
MQRTRSSGLLHLLPLFIPFALFFLWGIGYTLQGAFSGASTAGGPTLQHFRYVFMDPLLRTSVLHSLMIAFTSATIAVAGGTLLALGLWTLPRRAQTLALIYKLPIILPHLTAAFIVMILFARSGILASAAYQFGLIGDIAAFPDLLYGDSKIGLVAAYVWKEAPFAALLIISVLSKLNFEYVHTARMLGAGRWFTFRSVVYPHIAPVLDTSFIILFLYTLGAFDIPYVLGGSSPRMLSITVYNLYFRRDLAVRPQALALLTLLFAFSLVFVVIFFRITRRMRGREAAL